MMPISISAGKGGVFCMSKVTKTDLKNNTKS